MLAVRVLLKFDHDHQSFQTDLFLMQLRYVSCSASAISHERFPYDCLSFFFNFSNVVNFDFPSCLFAPMLLHLFFSPYTLTLLHNHHRISHKPWSLPLTTIPFSFRIPAPSTTTTTTSSKNHLHHPPSTITEQRQQPSSPPPPKHHHHV